MYFFVFKTTVSTVSHYYNIHESLNNVAFILCHCRHNYCFLISKQSIVNVQVKITTERKGFFWKLRYNLVNPVNLLLSNNEVPENQTLYLTPKSIDYGESTYTTRS